MKSNIQQLPNGWVNVKLGEISEIKYGKGLPTKQLIDSGYPVFGANGVIGYYDKFSYENEQLLISCRGANSGTINFSPKNCFVTNNSLIVDFCAEPIQLRKTLFYFLQSANKERLVTGTAQPQVTINNAVELELSLPPINEQRRIVAKIEELFSELDKGIENLKTAGAQLKIYRQALLKHAFEGKLTAQWRAQNQDKLETADALLKRIQQERTQRYQQQLADWEATGQGNKPKAIKPLPSLSKEELAELTELPKGWGWCKLGDFIDSIDAGKSFKCDEREPSADEIGVAKVSAVTWGEYDESESKTCTDTSKENESYFIKIGDFILSRANTIDLVGACVIARKVTKKIMLSDKTLRIRFGGFSQEYFLQYLGSRIGRKQIMRLSTGNQESMRNIGQDRIRSITVPICSKIEADVVIETLAARLSEVDQLHQTITTSLLQSEALRQSILKKAFSGRLLPQDTNDEPASELLARIKIEQLGNKIRAKS